MCHLHCTAGLWDPYLAPGQMDDARLPHRLSVWQGFFVTCVCTLCAMPGKTPGSMQEVSTMLRYYVACVCTLSALYAW